MKSVMLAALVCLSSIWCNNAQALTYLCKSIIGTTASSNQRVDAATNTEYVWYLGDYPEVTSSCARPEGKNTLHCSVRGFRWGEEIVHLEGAIRVGEKRLDISSLQCFDRVPCQIKCALEQPFEARD